MNKKTYLARCAPIAIAAMAALPATPALAQDAATPAPVIVLPEPVVATAAPAPAPVVIDIPTLAPEAVTAAEEPNATTTTRATTTEAAPVRATRSIPRRASAASTPESSSQSMAASEASIAPAPVDPAMIEGAPIEAAPAQPTIAETVAPIQDNSSEALLLGLFGALGIGGIGLALLRSRRRHKAEPELIERPVVTRQPLPAAPVMARDGRSQRNTPVYSTPGATVPAHGAAVALPIGLPSSFEERDSLLRDMIAAKPDKANPFRSRGARAKRARLILQSLGRDFGNRKPRIDLSQYTNVWPALRGWQPAPA